MAYPSENQGESPFLDEETIAATGYGPAMESPTFGAQYEFESPFLNTFFQSEQTSSAVSEIENLASNWGEAQIEGFGEGEGNTERAYGEEELPYAGELDNNKEESPFSAEEPQSLQEEEEPYLELEGGIIRPDRPEYGYLEEEKESGPALGLRQRIVERAKQEWERWGRGTKKETDADMHDVLRSYWETVLNREAAKQAIRDRSPWSAAFVSYVMRNAGAGDAFKYDTAHYVYVSYAKMALQKGDRSKFWAYDISNAKPELGDLVCRDRQANSHCGGTTYANVDDGSRRATHSDIVIEVIPDSITVIGGNVGGSGCGAGEGCTVNTRTIKLDSRGYVIPGQSKCKYFAIVKPPEPVSPASSTPGSDSILATFPNHIADAVRKGRLTLQVALAVMTGQRDTNLLTNMVFYSRHPELPAGYKIGPADQHLAREWVQIRDQMVKPLLQAVSSSSPSSVSQPAAMAPPAMREPTPESVGVSPPGPLGMLKIESPDRLRITYPFTPEDAVWTARFITGESGIQNDANGHAVVWAMFNRFALYWHSVNKESFGKFVQAYSTTLQPYLRNPDAVYRAIGYSREDPRKFNWVQSGTFIYRGKNKKYDGSEIPKGQLQHHIDLQQRPWNRIEAPVRLMSENLLRGQIPNPGIGLSSEFANTLTFLTRKLREEGRNLKNSPIGHEEWKRYTENYGRYKGVKGWTWIGENPRLDQMKENAFFIDNRSVGLPDDTVRVISP